MTYFSNATRGLLVASFLACGASADTVTLKTEDESLLLQGELEDFDGEYFFLRTKVGLLRVEARAIICEGEACPDLKPSPNFAVSGAAELVNGLFPNLLTSFAETS